MGLLDAGAEEPKSKALRYVVSGVALALFLGISMWYFLRYTTEKHTVEHFMDAVVTGNSQQAYQIWHPHSSFSYQDFLSFWGPNGYYGPIKSYHLEHLERLPSAAGAAPSGVVATIEVSPYSPFPDDHDAAKQSKTKEARIWVEFKDQSLAFPP